MPTVEKTIESRIVYEGPAFDVKKHKVSAKDGIITERDILENRGGVVIIGITETGKVLMVNQYRKAIERDSLELPAGKIEAGEESRVAALREFEEETGYKAKEIEFLLSIYTSVGYSNEKLDIYFCKDLRKTETNFDETEDIEIIEYDADVLLKKIFQGEIMDAKTIIGLLYLKEKIY